MAPLNRNHSSYSSPSSESHNHTAEDTQAALPAQSSPKVTTGTCNNSQGHCWHLSTEATQAALHKVPKAITIRSKIPKLFFLHKSSPKVTPGTRTKLLKPTTLSLPKTEILRLTTGTCRQLAKLQLAPLSLHQAVLRNTSRLLAGMFLQPLPPEPQLLFHLFCQQPNGPLTVFVH